MVMPNLLCFSRNRCTSVEYVNDQKIRSKCRLQDTLADASVEITARLPDLDIASIKSDVRSSHRSECLAPADYLQKLIGVRIGPGMLKIIKGLIGETIYCRQLAFMVEECCHGIILHFTKGVLAQTPKDEEGARQYFSDMVKENIRLINRCAAFSPGSSLVDKTEPT